MPAKTARPAAKMNASPALGSPIETDIRASATSDAATVIAMQMATRRSRSHSHDRKELKYLRSRVFA